MNTKIITWNVRGLNEGTKRLQVRNLLHSWKADLVCLQETKLHTVNRKLIQSIWRCRHMDWLCQDSNGASGGILLMWDKRVTVKIEEAVGMHSVSCKFREVASGFEWAFSGVYGPSSGADRGRLWEELLGVFYWWDVP